MEYTAGYHKEIPDQTPVEMPLGYKTPETLEQLIARMMRTQNLRLEAEKQDADTFEEADDFDVMDDVEMQSPYEMKDMEEEYLDERIKALANTKGSSTVGRENMDDSESQGEPQKMEAAPSKMVQKAEPKPKRGTQRRSDSTPRDNSDGGAEQE